jgi:L-seryl-tRNA(Ser) seleniumtransferase
VATAGARRSGIASAEAAGALRLPSVDAVLRTEAARTAIERFGRSATTGAVRDRLDESRAAWQRGEVEPSSAELVAVEAHQRLELAASPSQRRVFNLTGTVLHTNLGRALLAEAALTAVQVAMSAPTTLEFDLDRGERGERDDHARGLLRRLTGAEDACLVNNNAAAVLLVLNTLAKGGEAVVSRGELIEIGGAFRMPDIMARAGCRLAEIGTTNRTHLEDYAAAISPRAALLLKVHTSNYAIVGFTASVPTRQLATLARQHGLPLIEDLGSGTLIDLARFGLAHEPTVAEAIEAGADLVTFSGDKILGGPQAGLIVGRADLIRKLNRNPLKRALRLDKLRLAALEATLKLYLDPDRLPDRLPTLRLFLRSADDLAALAEQAEVGLAGVLGDRFEVTTVPCSSQIGSGALPLASLPSRGVALKPRARRGQGRALSALAAALRRLPIPVIGRIEGGRLLLDVRCLDDPERFLAQLPKLALEGTGAAA